MSHDNYLYRKDKLMRAFDSGLARIKSDVSSWLGEERAERFMWEACQEYETLIPRIPYIGDNNLMLTFFYPVTRYLAVYRALQRQGRTLEDAGRLIFLISEKEARAIPYVVRRLMEALWFSPWFRRLLKKGAIRSQQHRYPGGFVLTYVEGDGQEFDYGIDYTDCANCLFLQAENAFELAPYVCATDKPISELLGWGLTRPRTIAEGFPTCGFRFKKGGATNVPIPQSLLAPLGTKT